LVNLITLQPHPHFEGSWDSQWTEKHSRFSSGYHRYTKWEIQIVILKRSIKYKETFAYNGLKMAMEWQKNVKNVFELDLDEH